MSESEARLFARLADFVDGHGNDAERREVERLIRTNSAAARLAGEIREDSAQLRGVLGWMLPSNSVVPPMRDAEARRSVRALKTLVAATENKRLGRQRLRIGVLGLAAAAAAVGFVVLRAAPIVGEAKVLRQAFTSSEVRRFAVRTNQPVEADGTTRIEVKLSSGSVVTLDSGASVAFDTGVMTVRRGTLTGTAGPDGFQVRLSGGLIRVAKNGRFTLDCNEGRTSFVPWDTDATFSGERGDWLLPAGKKARIDSRGSVIEGPP